MKIQIIPQTQQGHEALNKMAQDESTAKLEKRRVEVIKTNESYTLKFIWEQYNEAAIKLANHSEVAKARTTKFIEAAIKKMLRLYGAKQTDYKINIDWEQNK